MLMKNHKTIAFKLCFSNRALSSNKIGNGKMHVWEICFRVLHEKKKRVLWSNKLEKHWINQLTGSFQDFFFFETLIFALCTRSLTQRVADVPEFCKPTCFIGDYSVGWCRAEDTREGQCWRIITIITMIIFTRSPHSDLA